MAKKEFEKKKAKAQARKAMLEMAKEWDKQKKTQHAVEGYEAVIEADPASKEADQAKDALMEIAKRYEQKGKKHSAYYLYHKLAEGQAGSHD